jgi:hypothetical protein
MIEQSDCKVIQVIFTRLTRAGKGVEGSPLRRLEQYWSLDGELLFTHDPCPDEGKEIVTP